MVLNITQSMRRIFRFSFHQLALAFLVCTLANGSDILGQKYVGSNINIEFKDIAIKKALVLIEREADVKFVYSSDVVDVNKKVSVRAQNASLEKILDELLKPLSIDYVITSDRVMLKRSYKNESQSQIQNSKSTQEPYAFKSSSVVLFAVTGIVKDEKGETLLGVSVSVKGTDIGTTTDIDGRYELEVIDKNSTLIFSYIGYLSQEVLLDGKGILDVVLKSDVKVLEEVVVLGYGSQKKADLTGSVASVNINQMLTKPAADVSNMLQGRVAGVVASGSNQPGGEGYVRIRGISSFGNNEPLVIIDGVQTSGTNSINPNDIESMNILKDASSAAIYGARGAAGVIIITTKKGKPNKSSITYDTYYGISDVTRYPEMLNTTEYADLIWKQQLGAGQTPKSSQYGSGPSPVIPDYVLAGSSGGLFEGNPAVDPSRYNFNQNGFYQIVRANKSGTDWFKEMTQQSLTKSHNLSASGGTEKSLYSLSLGYYSEEGLLKYTNYDRYSIRANSEFKITSRLTVGQTLFGSYRDVNGTGDNDEGSAWSHAYRMQPIIPVYDIANNFAGSKAPEAGNGQNPVAILYRARNNSNKDIRLLSSVYGEVDVIKGLKARTSFGIDYNNNFNKAFQDVNPEYSEGNFQTQLSLASGFQYRWTFTNTINYVKTIGLHDFNVLGGIEAVDFRREQLGGTRNGYYPFTDETFRVLDRGNPIGQNNRSFIGVEALYSNFARLDYTFNNRYLFNATVRRDGSSKFAKDVRFGVFPSVSVGWRISDEAFFKNITAISDMKIRMGYGRVGNDQIDPNNQFSFYRSDPSRSFYDIKGSNTSSTQGYDLDRKGNPASKWEETGTVNLGLDMELLEGKLEINLDLYNKKTSNLLVQLPRPGAEGDFSAPFTNIGNTENKGIDLNLIHRGSALGRSLTYQLSTNFSVYRNKVTSDGVDFFTNQVRYGLISRTISGEAIGQFYGYKIEGFFNNTAEVLAAPTQIGINKSSEAAARTAVGKWRYSDTNSDGKIDANDRVFLGSPHPKFQMGFNYDVQYKNFDLGLFLFWNYGNQIYNNTKWWTDMNGSFAGNRSKTMLYNSWTPENPNALLPKLDANDNINSSVPNSYYVESGSYLRAKTMQLGYTMPTNKYLKVNRLRVYVQGQNLFTITKYTGPDPDLLNVGRGDIGLGVDHGRIPNPKQLIMGANLVF
jgi:TonB-linked SusC/RagA family outer membrane protein